MNDLPKITEEQLMQNNDVMEIKISLLDRTLRAVYKDALVDVVDLQFVKDKLTLEEQFEILNLYKK